MIRRVALYGVIILTVLTCQFTASAQAPSSGPDEAAKAKAPEAAAAAPAAAQPKEIAIYGEVQAVNAGSSTLSVQYYDYDSDSEKTAEVAVSGATKMENASGLADVKKGDWVDVTYTVTEGKNLAETVSVEKEEPVTEAPAAAVAPAEE